MTQLTRQHGACKNLGLITFHILTFAEIVSSTLTLYISQNAFLHRFFNHNVNSPEMKARVNGRED